MDCNNNIMKMNIAADIRRKFRFEPSASTILYTITLLGLVGLGYYVYYLITNQMLSLEPFLKPEQLIFMYSPADLPYYQSNPAVFMQSLLTVIHFWLLIGGVIVYFTVITQFFNPFPLESGIYILMLDADRLRVLKLKSTTSKVFIYKNKAYFLPQQALKSEGNALYLLYMSNLSRALGNLTITLEEYQSSLDDTMEYLLGESKRLNKVGTVFNIFPRDALKRNYNLYIEEGKIIIRHDNTRGRKGHFKVTKFVRCNIYVASSFLNREKAKGKDIGIGKDKGKDKDKEDEVNDMQDITESKIIARLVTENMSEEIPLTNIAVAGGTTLKLKGYYKIVQYIESDLQLLNPSLVYDILSYRRFVQELHKYFIGFSVGALPILLIVVAALILSLLLMNVDFSSILPFGQPSQPQGQTQP